MTNAARVRPLQASAGAFESPPDDAQRAKLLEIADKCPVHRTLHAEVSIVNAAGAPRSNRGEGVQS